MVTYINVLLPLFIKYVSDKYAGVAYAPIAIPADASFTDMVALEGKSDIGDQINQRIVAPLVAANKLSDMPDFNDPTSWAVACILPHGVLFRGNTEADIRRNLVRKGRADVPRDGLRKQQAARADFSRR